MRLSGNFFAVDLHTWRSTGCCHDPALLHLGEAEVTDHDLAVWLRAAGKILYLSPCDLKQNFVNGIDRLAYVSPLHCKFRKSARRNF